MKNCLTAAGSDCSGGAGIQADIKTFGALGCYGMSVITSVVAENTAKVISVCNMSEKTVEDQLEAVFSDIRVDAVKLGMLPDSGIISAVCRALVKYRPPAVICDPVMAATAGDSLMEKEALHTFVNELMPLCTVLTPNIPEAETLTGNKIRDISGMKAAALKLCGMGPEYVLVKGGHLDGSADDILSDGKAFRTYSHTRINSTATHGTGCTLSSAITAFIANGNDVFTAVGLAKDYLSGAVMNGFEDIGSGYGPTDHFWQYRKNIKTDL